MATAVAEKPKTAVEDPNATLQSAMVPLMAAVQNYGWGIKGAASTVAVIHSRNSVSQIDGTKPYAELWMGSHPSGPARILHDQETTLGEYMEKSAQFVVGEKVMDGLPYLLKVLSVGGALSIQAHPNKEHAKILHDKNPTAYKDDNHKPEMAVALSNFDALCGFRACEDIMKDVTRVPEFADAVGRIEAEDFVKVVKSGTGQQVALRSLFGALMRQEEERIKNCLNLLMDRLQKMESDQITAQDRTMQSLYEQYPGDVGCFAAYLMNKLTMKPGEALFIGANEPHAYLKGECVEIMANSDNVVRAGLTPKFKDVDVLIDMLTYKDGEPEMMNGEGVNEFTRIYRPPCEDFQLEKISLPEGESVKLDATLGPAILLTLGGDGRASLSSKKGAPSVPLFTGTVYYCNPNNKLHITCTSETPLLVFRSNVNEKLISENRSGSICTIQ